MTTYEYIKRRNKIDTEESKPKDLENDNNSPRDEHVSNISAESPEKGEFFIG